MTANAKPAQKPVHKIPAGSLEVAIWLREGEKGPFYSVTARRRYKQGEEWKDSDSYGEDDLLRLAKLIEEADSWIVAQRRAQRASKAA
jgi:hypothetical protein